MEWNTGFIVKISSPWRGEVAGLRTVYSRIMYKDIHEKFRVFLESKGANFLKLEKSPFWYVFMRVPKKLLSEKVLSWFQQCHSEGKMWHSSMSWWHLCTKQASHTTLFPFFTLCASLIALQLSSPQCHAGNTVLARFLLMKSFFSFPLFFINSEQELAYTTNLLVQRLQVQIIYYSLQACFCQVAVVESSSSVHWCKIDLCSGLSFTVLSMPVKWAGAWVRPTNSDLRLGHMDAAKPLSSSVKWGE